MLHWEFGSVVHLSCSNSTVWQQTGHFFNSEEAFCLENEATLSQVGFKLSRLDQNKVTLCITAGTEQVRSLTVLRGFDVTLPISCWQCLCPLLCRPLQDFGLLHRADAGDQGAHPVFQKSAKGHRGEWQGELYWDVGFIISTMIKSAVYLQTDWLEYAALHYFLL